MPARSPHAPPDPPPRKQAVIYARVSSKEQEKEGFSIPAQLKLLKDYAAAQGFAVAQEYVDVETAKQTGRAAFGEMVAWLKAHPAVRVLLVEKTDRLYRNLKDWVTIDELDVEIHFPKEGVVLSRESRSSEKFMHGIKVLMAKNYIDNLSEEARKGLQEKAEQGIWPTKTPLGYRNVTGPDGKQGHRRRSRGRADHLEAVRVVRDRRVCAEGGRQEGARRWPRLHEERRAGAHQHRAFDPAQPPLHRLVRVERQALSGQARAAGLGRAVGAGAGRDGRPQRQQASPHDPRLRLLGTDRLRQVRLLGGRRDQEAEVHLLPLHRLRRQMPGQPGLLPSQVCARGGAGAAVHGDCSAGSASTTRCWTGCARRCTPATPTSGASTRRRSSGSRPSTSASQARIDAMYIDKLDGKIGGDFFDKMAGQWREEQTRCLRDIERHQEAEQSYMDEGVRILELARNAQALFERQPAREKRRLLNFVLSNCSWEDGEVVATFRQPFDLLAETTAIAARQRRGTAAIRRKMRFG